MTIRVHKAEEGAEEQYVAVVTRLEGTPEGTTVVQDVYELPTYISVQEMMRRIGQTGFTRVCVEPVQPLKREYPPLP